ncbi:membrane protein [Actinoallomurus oryzae]|uniref:Membrane protein n=1 Tax=Actinoallomurus oryzae TaxID=502180 RepID=A0ABP8QTR0_9ACTN
MTDPRAWGTPGSGAPPSDEARATPGSDTPPSDEARVTPGADAPPSDGVWATPGADRPPSDRPAPPVPEPAADEPELETEIPLRPLGVSEILDGAVTYIRRNPRATLGMSAVMTTVVEVVVTLAQYFLIGSQARTEITPGAVEKSVGWAFVISAGSLLLTAYVVLLLSGLLAPVMARTLLGRPTSLVHAWRAVRPCLGRLFGAATAVLVAVFLALAIPLTPMIAAVAVDAPVGVQAVTWILGAPLAFVAMVMAYIWLAFSTPILVMEHRGVIASLRRSAEMVRGRWWRTFGVLFLALVITVLAEFVVIPGPFTVVVEIVANVHPNPSGGLLVALLAVSAVGRIVAGTLVNPFNAGVIAIVYADRRMRREAFDLELQMRPPDDPLAAWLPGPLTAAGSGPQPKVRRTPVPWTAPAPPPPPPPGWPR